MSRKKLSQARSQVRNALGTEFARKASAELIMALADSTRDKATTTQSSLRAVIELTPQEPRAMLQPDVVERLRGSGAVRDALAAARAALHEIGGEALAAHSQMFASPAALLRAASVNEMKDRCYREAAPIRNELHRNFASLPGGGEHPIPRARTGVQFSWLNQSFAAWVNVSALAALAADPRVYRVDVPRRLRLHMKASANVIGAIDHRQKTGHGGKGVKVAVIDAEVALLKDVFQNRVAHMKDFTGEGWGQPHRHGTSVAAIIAANSPTAMGIAPDARIYNYKVVATTSVTEPEDLHGACALSHAVADGMDIANCSWGTQGPTDGTSREVRACDNAWKCGMTVVHAAGNDGKKGVSRPAEAAGVIVVGATGPDGTSVQEYSGRGPTKTNKPAPDLVAPGGTTNVGIRSFDENGNFVDCGYGTSLAAPHVTGIVALLLEADSGLTPDEQFARLKNICGKLAHSGPNDQGHGLPSLLRLA